MTTGASDPLPPLTARLLGPVRIAVGERVLSAEYWPRRTARSLLLLLLVTPGYRLSRDHVLDRLWPEEDPERAANALYQALHGLRRVLEPHLARGRDSSYVAADRDAIALRPHPGLWSDVDALDRALDHAAVATGAERAEALRAAIDRYAGDLLAEEPRHEWALARREQLRQRHHDATLALARLALANGDAGSSIADLERLTTDDPTDEAAQRALMRAFAAVGQRERALRQYERCQNALQTELDVAPHAETAALFAEISAASVDRSPHLVKATPNRPRFTPVPAPPNALVGRDRELADLQDLLWDPEVRLVTLTGPGGVGKTRLAQEAARQFGNEFSGGVGFVACATVTEAMMVLPTMARALHADDLPGRTALDAIVATVGTDRVLVVLDNLEQVIGAGPDLAAVLDACPGMTMLATSREPLHLRAEHEFTAPSLSVPDERWSTIAGLARYEAVDLFARRMRAVRPDFVLSETNAATVAELCTRLDGLPLAIELAAARGRTLSPGQMLAGLTDRFALLADGYHDLPPRQRTIHDAIAWSFDLLTAPEQTLARRLSVFAGSCTVEDAAAVMAAATGATEATVASTATTIEALVERSWGRWDRAAGESRFAMLETIREFGLARLVEHDERDCLRRAHATVFLDLAERAEPELTGPRQADWLDRLQHDHANLVAALDWATTGSPPMPDVAFRLAARLHRYWRLRGFLTEGRGWLRAALALDGGDPDGRANALRVAGDLANDQGDNAEAVDLLERAIATWHDSGTRTVGLARALAALGQVAHEQGDFARALALHAEALALNQDLGDQWGIAQGHGNLGTVAYYQGDLALSETHWMAAVDLYRALEDRSNVAAQLSNLANLMTQRGEFDRAREYCEQALAIQRRLDLRLGMAISIVALGGIAFARRELTVAAAHYQESVSLFEDLNYPNGVAVARHNLGVIALETGDPVAARPHLIASLTTLSDIGDRARAAMAIESLARVHGAEGRWDQAARLLGTAAALWDATGASRDPTDEQTIANLHESARAALGSPDFAAEIAAGRARSLDAAVLDARAIESSTA